jgi:hypothetical protein
VIWLSIAATFASAFETCASDAWIFSGVLEAVMTASWSFDVL